MDKKYIQYILKEGAPLRYGRYRTVGGQVPELAAGQGSHAGTRTWRQATYAESTTAEDESRSRQSGEAAALPGGSCTSSMSPAPVAEEAAAAVAAAGAAAAAEAAAGAAAAATRESSKSVSGFRLQRGQERAMYLVVGVWLGFGHWGGG